MSYLKSTRPTSLKSTPPHLPVLLHLPSQRFFHLPPYVADLFWMPKNLLCVGVVSWGDGLSQERQPRFATTTWYMITDHRHAPSKHSTTATADKKATILAACLPSYLWHSRVQTLNVPARRSFKPHRIFKTQVTSFWISLSLFFFFCFSSHPIGVEATKVFLATS